MFVVAAAAYQLVAPAPPATAGAAAGIGCLSQTLSACVDTLRRTYRIEQSDVDGALTNMSRVDVNGRRLASSNYAMLFGTFKDPPGGMDVLSLTLDDSARVTSLELGLASDPQLANTEEEYDRTRLFEVMSLVLPANCDLGDRMTLYRFFQNEVKPAIRHSPATRSFSGGEASELSGSRAPAFTRCGVNFVYHSTSGFSTGSISRYNPRGTIYRTTLRFSLPGSPAR